MSKESRFSKFVIISSFIHFFTCVFFTIAFSRQTNYENPQKTGLKIKISKEKERRDDSPLLSKELQKLKNEETTKTNINEEIRKENNASPNNKKEEKIVQSKTEEPRKIIDFSLQCAFIYPEKSASEQPAAINLKNELSNKKENENSLPYDLDLNSDKIDEETKKWLREIRLKISTIASYPEYARRKKMGGAVMLQVTVYKNGQIKSIDFIGKSEYEILNEAAINKVKRAAPFPKFPKDINSHLISFSITIIYKAV